MAELQSPLSVAKQAYLLVSSDGSVEGGNEEARKYLSAYLSRLPLLDLKEALARAASNGALLELSPGLSLQVVKLLMGSELVGLRTPAQATPTSYLLVVRPQVEGLTLSERRVLDQLVRGLTSKEIARASGVSVSTVRTQIASIRAKSGASSIRELILKTVGPSPT